VEPKPVIDNGGSPKASTTFDGHIFFLLYIFVNGVEEDGLEVHYRQISCYDSHEPCR